MKGGRTRVDAHDENSAMGNRKRMFFFNSQLYSNEEARARTKLKKEDLGKIWGESAGFKKRLGLEGDAVDNP